MVGYDLLLRHPTVDMDTAVHWDGVWVVSRAKIVANLRLGAGNGSAIFRGGRPDLLLGQTMGSASSSVRQSVAGTLSPSGAWL